MNSTLNFEQQICSSTKKTTFVEKTKMYRYLTILTAILFLYSCSKVAITGRSQFDIVPDGEMQSMSYSQYQKVLSSSKLSSNAAQVELVRRVGRNIQLAVEKYFADNKMSSQLKGYAWEFNLIEDPQVNAWCMPGGKVAVYTGILSFTQNEEGLAVVLGHEVSHAIAKHGSERMSQQMVEQMGGVALSLAIATQPTQTQQLFMTAYGLGAQYGVLLPYSRLHETEADHLGLLFMAMAGYDPSSAVTFWQRMAAQGGPKPPEIFSTHPSDQTRIANIQKELPEAMKYYSPKK